VTTFLNKRSSTQFYHDWKPMQSIIDMLHKNFQEYHTNSRRCPGVVDTLISGFAECYRCMLWNSVPWQS